MSRKGSKKIIHVNQHRIRANTKTGARVPVLTVKTGRDNQYAHEVDILDLDGRVMASIVYRPDKPLKCGARVWIETTNTVELHRRTEDEENTEHPN